MYVRPRKGVWKLVYHEKQFLIQDDAALSAAVTLNCPTSSSCVTLMGINVSNVHNTACLCVFFFLPLAFSLEIYINLSSFLPHPVVGAVSPETDRGRKCMVSLYVCVYLFIYFARLNENYGGKRREIVLKMAGGGKKSWYQGERLACNEMPTKRGRIRGPRTSQSEPPLKSTEDGWDCSS